jgi:hypothetical protein
MAEIAAARRAAPSSGSGSSHAPAGDRLTQLIDDPSLQHLGQCRLIGAIDRDDPEVDIGERVGALSAQ